MTTAPPEGKLQKSGAEFSGENTASQAKIISVPFLAK